MAERERKRKLWKKAPEGFIDPNRLARILKTSVPTLVRVVERVEFESGRPLDVSGHFISESEIPRLADGLEAHPHRRRVGKTINNGHSPK